MRHLAHFSPAKCRIFITCSFLTCFILTTHRSRIIFTQLKSFKPSLGHNMKIKFTLLLAAILATATQGFAQTTDPLPNISLPMGHVKKMGADFIKDITGVAVEKFADYLIDYSHASFQLERASWREGLSHRYAGMDHQTFRRVDWMNTTRAFYQTETIEINLHTKERKTFPLNPSRFSDFEEANRYWRSYVTVEGKLQREKAWIMKIDHRLRNTYYKGAKFPSKQMSGPLYPRIYCRIKTLPNLEINGSNQGFQTSYARGYKSVYVPLNGVSSAFELISRANSRLDCDHTTDLFQPGEDDNGMNGSVCP